MQRIAVVFLLVATLLLIAPNARAGDEPNPRDPTPAELARLILEGNAGEHALVAAWLEDADRATLRAVFAQLRARRQARPGKPPLPVASAPKAVRAPTVRVKRRSEPIRPKGAEKGDAPLMHAEVRVIDITAGRAEDLLGALRPTADAPCVPLKQADVDALMRTVEKSADATVVTAPRLTVHFGQKGNVSLIEKVAYVRDYEMVKAKDGRVMADPVVDVIQEGVVIDLVGTWDEETQEIEAEFKGTWADLKRPIGELDTEIDGQKLTIQLPELAVARVRVKARLPSDGWALLGGGGTLGSGDDAVERVALLHLRRVDLVPEPKLVPRGFAPPPPPSPGK